MVNKNMYDNEPWAALVRECGLEPTDTEMQARTVARHATTKLESLLSFVARVHGNRCVNKYSATLYQDSHAILQEYKKMGYRVVSPYASRGEGK